MIHAFILEMGNISTFDFILGSVLYEFESAGFRFNFWFVFLVLLKLFYLFTLQCTMQKTKPENREMSPTRVWLEIIPFFGLVWQFFNITYISNSLKKEFVSRNITLNETRPAYGIGLAMCILFCCWLIPSHLIRFVGFWGWLIGWAIYWVKIVSYKNML